jgi:hypothetical protein
LRKNLLGIVACLIVLSGSALALSPAQNVVIALPRGPSALPAYDNVMTNWQNAGLAVVGGIPTRSTVCATVNPIGSGSDDYTDIQNAINACPAGEVVQLGSGTFTVHVADLPIKIPTGITLRGTGLCTGSSSPYCSSVITVSDGLLAYQNNGPQCGVNTSSEAACPNGGPAVIQISPVNPAYNYSWAQCGNIGGLVPTGLSCGAATLAADAAQGQTTIQINSTSAFSVGMWVLIDEASAGGLVTDPLDAAGASNGQVWATSDWLSSSGSPATGRIMWMDHTPNLTFVDDFAPGTFPYQFPTAGCWHSYCDRPTSEIHLITSIGAGPCPGTNCTLTFDDPLTIAFRQSNSHNAQVYRFFSNQAGTTPGSFINEASVENLSVLRAPNGGIEMEFCAYCWINTVEVADWYSGGVTIAYSVRSEIINTLINYCWDAVNSGGEYPIALDSASTEILLTNSITNFGGKGMVARAGGAGSVVSYSYFDDQMYDKWSGIGDYWIDMSANASHYVGPHHVLFEGNWADNLDNDHTHGSNAYITYFRNWATALRTPFTDPSTGQAVDDATGVGYACSSGTCTAHAPAPLRAIGPGSYNYWHAYIGNVLGTPGISTAANGWTYKGSFAENKNIYMLGWDPVSGKSDPNLTASSGAYIFLHGNYDYVNAAVEWDPNTPNHALPNSFYLTSAPSFFSAGTCTYPWPWVTPTGSSQIQTNSCSGSGLPAQARWNAGTPFVQP